MVFWSICWSLIGRRSYIKEPSSGDDRVHSQNHTPFTYIQPREPGNEHGYITGIDTSPHSVEIPNATDRPISNWLGFVYCRTSSTRGR